MQYTFDRLLDYMDSPAFAPVHEVTPEQLAQAPEFEVEDHNYVLICEEELQEIFERQGGKQS